MGTAMMIRLAVLLTVATAQSTPDYLTTTTDAVPTSTTTAIPASTTATTAAPVNTTTKAAVPLSSTAKYVCEDLNTDACRQLNASKLGYCNDVALSKPICPRFCGYCPSVCYHCDNVVANISDCTTTRVCGQNQLCMIKRLSSTLDGHHEYQLSCEDKQVCDGPGLTFPFVGRRSVESRDVSVHCCKDDLCNYPKQLRTTTQPPVTMVTGCSRDIMFLIDTSVRLHLPAHGHHGSHSTQSIQSSLQLVHDIISQLTIGPYDNLVSLATFDRSVHKQWDLDDQYTKAGLLKELANVHEKAQFALHGDIDDALNYLLRHMMDDDHGDRKNFPDDVIIITDSASAFHSSLLKTQLQRKSRDVIVVSVGSTAFGSGTASNLATDSAHKIQVSSYANLPSIGGKLFSLLCT